MNQHTEHGVTEERKHDIAAGLFGFSILRSIDVVGMEACPILADLVPSLPRGREEIGLDLFGTGPP